MIKITVDLETRTASVEFDDGIVKQLAGVRTVINAAIPELDEDATHATDRPTYKVGTVPEPGRRTIMISGLLEE